MMFKYIILILIMMYVAGCVSHETITDKDGNEFRVEVRE